MLVADVAAGDCERVGTVVYVALAVTVDTGVRARPDS